MRSIEAMFNKYEGEHSSALAFVLMGSFMSAPFHNTGNSTRYKELFNDLAELIDRFPRLKTNAHFIFVPGPNDPWQASGSLPIQGGPSIAAIPYRPIPYVFTNRVRRICKKVDFMTNPCRLAYFTQEIVVFRDDLCDRFFRNRLRLKQVTEFDHSKNVMIQCPKLAKH